MGKKRATAIAECPLFFGGENEYDKNLLNNQETGRFLVFYTLFLKKQKKMWVLFFDETTNGSHSEVYPDTPAR